MWGEGGREGAKQVVVQSGAQVNKGWKVLLGCEHMYMQNVSLV